MRFILQTKKGLALFLGLAVTFMLAGCGADSVFDNNIDGSGLTVEVKPDGTTPVVLNTDITGTFNKDVQQSTLIKDTTVYLLDPNGNKLAGTLTYLNKVMRFKPAADLLPNTTYRFVITNDVRGTDTSQLGADKITEFTTGTGFGLTVTLNPKDNDTNVSLNPKITATFNEAVKISTLTASNFYLKDSNGAIVPTTIEHTDDNVTGILKLASNLTKYSAYTIVVTKLVESVNGYNLANDENATFLTGDWLRLAVTIVPSNGTTNVPIDTMITATFNKPMDTSTLNSGNIYLVDENGTHVPGELYTNTNASGNTVVTFRLKPGFTLAPNSDYTFVVENDVTALDGEQLGTDEKSTFRTGTQTELQVILQPADGASSVPVSSNMIAYFNEDINATTLTAATFHLENNVTGAVPGTISYDSGNYIALLNPDANLTAYGSFTFTVTTGVTALNGNTLASDKSSTFTTGNLIRVLDAAVFTMNSNGATVDTNQSDLLGSIVGNLLGIQLQVDADGVQGLAEADISFNGLLQGIASDVNATTIQQLLNSNISLTSLLQIISDQLGALPAGPAQGVIDQLIAAIDSNGTNQLIPVGDLLQFPVDMLPLNVSDVLALGGFSGASTNAFALLSAVNALLAPITESIIEVPLGIPGLTDENSTLRLQLVRPAEYAVMKQGDTIRSAEARIQLNLGVNGSLVSGLLALLGGTGNELVNIPLYVVLGSAEGNLTELSPDAVKMAVQNGLASVYLGSIPDNIFFSNTPIGPDDFNATTLVDLSLLGVQIAKVEAKAYAQGDHNNTVMNFLPVNVAQTDSAFSPLGDTTNTLVGTLTSNLELKVTLLGIELGTGDALLGNILASVTGLLGNLVLNLAPTLNAISDLLGAYTGRADVTMLSLIEHYIEQP